MTVIASVFYCPYIPLQVVTYFPYSIEVMKQEGMAFEFNPTFFIGACHWLEHECVWTYKLEGEGHVLRVTFEDVAGAVEFKLRFKK